MNAFALPFAMGGLLSSLLASALGSEVAVQADDPTIFLLSRVPAGLFAHTLNQLRAVRPQITALLHCCAVP